MTLISIIASIIISAGCGGRFDMPPRKLGHTIPTCCFGILLLCNAPDFGWWCAWMYAFAVIRLLPTAGLITATNKIIPQYSNSKLRNWLIHSTFRMWNILQYKGGLYGWSILYGFIRTLPVVLAAWYLGNTALYFAPLIGVVYWLSGVICRRWWQENKAVAVAEVVIGGFIGWAL